LAKGTREIEGRRRPEGSRNKGGSEECWGGVLGGGWKRGDSTKGGAKVKPHIGVLGDRKGGHWKRISLEEGGSGERPLGLCNYAVYFKELTARRVAIWGKPDILRKGQESQWGDRKCLGGGAHDGARRKDASRRGRTEKMVNENSSPARIQFNMEK